MASIFTTCVIGRLPRTVPPPSVAVGGIGAAAGVALGANAIALVPKGPVGCGGIASS